MDRIRKIIDLSHSLHAGMPVFPGDSPPLFSENASIAGKGFRDLEMTFGSHIGTHVDAPAHVFQEGRFLEQMALNSFIGAACCLDLTSLTRRRIEPRDLNPFRDLIMENEFVLLHTAWSCCWGKDEYYRDYPILSCEAATWLAAFPLKGIGIDAPSPDRVDDIGLPVHRVLLDHNICLVENLTGLDGLPGDGFFFSCLPLKIAQGNGSPVRAAAIVFE